ncbi:MAG: hypothetical protein M1828_004328 [Chrysothrix sp. TS-e1954]|nr:MAG: hypothetical protein M1828_004328 [Chrysothrix sp. TS-e1954]
MRQCLTSSDGGFYTTRNIPGKDQFGKTGDFVTSPEISQIFGELVGIWFVAEWMSQGRKAGGVQLMELGPGRGTLMDDVLRTVAKFGPMASSIETVYLVEASPILREAQHNLLCSSNPMVETKVGHESSLNRLPGVKIVWLEDLKFMPEGNDKMPLVIAHEFLDALPIHAFQLATVRKPALAERPNITTSTSPSHVSQKMTSRDSTTEWRELLVSPTAPPSPFDRPPQSKDEPRPEYELTLSPKPTPYSQLLPTLSPRWNKKHLREGAVIEVSPETRATTAAISRLIGGDGAASESPTSRQRKVKTKSVPSGAALIIDYGPQSVTPGNSLRGIRAHERVSPFTKPGQVDLSADVDFASVIEAALEASESVECHGPTHQAGWLESMGGGQRRDALTAQVSGADADVVKERIVKAWNRLVDRGPNGMGKLYQVLAIVPDSGGGRKPVGFGGDVAT